MIYYQKLAPSSAWRGCDTFMDDELLSVADMTRILKVSKATVQRWCRQRRLPAAKIGKAYRIRRGDLDEWYEQKLGERVRR